MLFQREVFAASCELKLVGDPGLGELGGYATVYDVLDWHRDIIKRGAFDKTLAEQKAAGRKMPMFGEHSFALLGGDPYPVGVWDEIEPDERGLRVKGRFIGLDHPDVARLHKLTKEGLTGGLSIAYNVTPDGYVKGKNPGDPLRTINQIQHLHSIDIVGDPSNPLARIDSVKAMLTMPNHQAAADAIQQAHQMCVDCMGGGDAPTADERNQITGNLKDAFRHLTGAEIPVATKVHFDQLRELKKWLHLPVEQGGRGFSSKQADEVAELVFKSLPRDESGDSAAASAARKEAVSEIRQLLSGFSLKFGE
jgi:HK97 family phage prohead protease